MILRKVLSAAGLAVAASFSSFASAGSCDLTNTSVKLSTQDAFEGQTIRLDYGADRQSCSGVGSYAYKVTVGSPAGLVLGACEGARTVTREDCSAEFPLPADFLGELQVYVNGITKIVNVSAKPTLPVVTPKNVSTLEDTPVEVELFVADEQYPAYEIVAISDLKSGSATIVGTKAVFKPATDWTGLAEIAYRAIDSNGQPSADVYISVQVSSTPDKPVLAQAALSGLEDEPLTYSPTVTDPDSGDSYNLVVVQQVPAEIGTVVADGDKIVFTPALNWFGETTFSIKAVDSFGLESYAQEYKVVIDNKNDAPVLTGSSFTLSEDSTVEYTVPYTDQDGAGPYTLYVSAQPSVAKGVCSVVGEVVTFTPAKNWSGTTSCKVAVADSFGGVGVAWLSFTVTAVNDAPVPVEKHLTLNQGASGSIGLTVVDPDPADTFTYALLDPADAGFGIVSVEGATLTVTPASDFYGTRKISLRAKDAAGALSAPFNVYVKVLPINGAPVISGQSYIVGKNEPFSVQVGAIDPNSDFPLTYLVSAQADPAKGVVTISGDMLTFTPASSFVGTATASIVAKDPGGLVSVPAVMSFQVEDALVIALDPDVPDTHTVVIVSQPPASVGTVSASGNKVTLVPVKGYFGSSTFTYKVRDSFGAESPVVTGQIVVGKYNYAPSASSAVLSAIEGQSSAPVTPLVTDENPYDSGLHTFIVPIQATTGFVEVVDNKLVYTASFGFSGVEKFKYIAVDQGGLSVVGEATVTVTPMNYAPDSISGIGSGVEGQPVTAAMIVKDRNPADTFTYSILSQVLGGTAAISSANLVFTPDEAFTGSVSVPVRVTDSGGLSVDGLVVFTVAKQNSAPTSVGGHIKVFENATSSPYYPSVADANIYDSGLHSLEIVVAPANGSAVIVNNRIIYTPGADYSGPDVIKIKATDPAGAAVEGDIAVTVTQVNSAPIKAQLGIYTEENIPSQPIFPTVTDPNPWDNFTFEIITQPSHGSVVITAEGFVYTPENAFYGSDEFNFRSVDMAGEIVESVASVNVAKKNYAPTGFTPGAVSFYEGVGATFQLKPLDTNHWGNHSFSITKQPDHGAIWVNGHTLVFRTTGSTSTEAIVRLTDQDGLFVDAPLVLTPRPVSDLIDGLPVIDLPDAALKTPASTTPYLRENGMPGFVVSDPAALAELGTEWVAVLDGSSEVGIRLSGKELAPSKGTRFVVDYLSATTIGTSISAIEAGKAGTAAVKVARLDGTGNVYRIPVRVWSPVADFQFSANPAVQLIDRVRGELVSNSPDCTFTVTEFTAKSGNPYDHPICLVDFVKRPMETKVISSDSSLAFLGPIETVGVQTVIANSYIVTATGEKHLVGTYQKDLQVDPVTDAVQIAPKYPFDTAYYRVQELDIDFKQSVGPTCDLTTVEYLAKNSAATYSIRPSCLVEWTEIPIGLTARQNWDRPYILGSSQYLGANSLKWNVSIYSPTGVKVPVGAGEFSFDSVMPPEVAFTYDSKTSKIGDNYFTSYFSGQYIGEATITSAAASLKLTHAFGDGKVVDEDIVAGFGTAMESRRRINVAPFTSLWESRELKASASYAALPDSTVESSITVVSIPDQAILPIIDNENQKILSTDLFEVTVGMGDIYNELNTYSSTTMGDWDIRLVTKPTWNSIDPLTDWAATDSSGKVSFDVELAALAGKNLRIFAEARPQSPIPEYQVHRMSPKPLSLAILNGAALDGSVRALRMTGEAPLRVTLFADVANRAWTKDLGAVRWEIQSEGGAWETVDNKSKSPQRLAQTFQKGTYKVRAELTNKNSGAKSMTDEIEIVAYNVPKGFLKGPGNTFLDAPATFKVLQVDGQPIDLSSIDVQWSYDRGVTWEDGVDTISQTRSTEQRLYVYARMKFKDSPTDDPRIWKTLRGGVAFRKVRPPRVQLIGPRRPEVGKEAVWVANMLMPYPNMDLTMNGEFIMPGTGSIVSGQEARYTPTDDDLALEMTEIKYRSWIEGYRDKGGEGLTTQRITFWLYDWPEWAIQPTFSSEYAPADLTLRVRNVGEFKGVEGVTFDWELPVVPGYDIVKEDNMALRIMSINDPGTYAFKVHVYDARGNYSLVERDMNFKEPPPWEVNMAWSGDNNAHRAPMDVLVRPYISGGHPKDSVTSLVYRLNGDVLNTGGSRYARANLPVEGTYAVTLDIETTMGKAANGQIDIAVKDNVPPTCELEVKEGATAWTATAKCLDTDGRIARHHWFVEDKLQGLGGSVITISKRTSPEPPHITLIAVDDSGEESPSIQW